MTSYFLLCKYKVFHFYKLKTMVFLFIGNNKEWCRNVDFFPFCKYIEYGICKKSSPSASGISLLQFFSEDGGTTKESASELLSTLLKMQSPTVIDAKSIREGLWGPKVTLTKLWSENHFAPVIILTVKPQSVKWI